MNTNITNPTIGAVLNGTVKLTLATKDAAKKPYGVLVTLEGGATGLLHVSELNGGNFNNRGQRLAQLKSGDAVTVEIIDVKADGGKSRISLSEKSLSNRAIIEGLPEGSEVEGTVAVVKESFAIVTILGGAANGVDAMLHVSQLPGSDPKTRDRQLAALAVGQSVKAEVTEVKTEGTELKLRLSQRAAAVRQQLARFGVGSTHTGDIVKRTDGGLIISFGAVSGFLPEADACSDKLKVKDRTRAIVVAVDGDGKLTLTRRGLK